MELPTRHIHVLRAASNISSLQLARALGGLRGVLIAVGDQAAVDIFRNEATEVVDLNGATVLPGFRDMHMHPMGAGMAQFQCLFPQGSTRRQIAAAVETCAARGVESAAAPCARTAWHRSSAGAQTGIEQWLLMDALPILLERGDQPCTDCLHLHQRAPTMTRDFFGRIGLEIGRNLCRAEPGPSNRKPPVATPSLPR